MKIVIGCDNLAVDMKNKIIAEFSKKGYEFTDMGVDSPEPMDYPDVGEKVARALAGGGYDRGILLCGTGIGMQICANKVPGVYAAVCHDIYSTERSILSNNCNMLCFGVLVAGPSTILTLTERWLALTFDENSPSAKKVEKMRNIK